MENVNQGPTVEEIRNNANELRSRLAAAGGRDIEILAVTKGFDVTLAHRAVQAGFSILGENYAQELLAKAPALAAQLESDPAETGREVAWTFIGRLQRNKVRKLAPIVSRWDTVDRPELVDEIAKRSAGATVLLQINVSDEPGKGGCEPDETGALIERAHGAGLVVEGLMTVGRTGSPEKARSGFKQLRTLCDRFELEVCSMGMSGDLEVAAQEGSTLVRVGTALFGSRPPRP